MYVESRKGLEANKPFRSVVAWNT